MGFYSNYGPLKYSYAGNSFKKLWESGARKNGTNAIQEFALGKPESQYQQSLLSPEQQPLSTQRQQAIGGPGAGGAYGTSADYYRDLLSPNSKNIEQMQAPELRRFKEETIPGIGEEFAGMGAGGLSSSGFRNSLTKAGVDLSERLGMMRENARMEGAQGLQGIGKQGMQQETENIYRPASGGFMEPYAKFAGNLVGQYATNQAMGG